MGCGAAALFGDWVKSKQVKGYLFVIASAMAWGSSAVAGKALFGLGVTPLEVVQVRLLVSCAILALFFVLRAPVLLRIRPADIAYFAALGGVAMTGLQVCYFYAIKEIQVAAAILLQYMAPVIVAVVSMLFWKERATAAKFWALGLSMAGCYLVVGGYNIQLSGVNRAGIAWGLAAALCFATNSLMSEHGMRRYSPWTVLFYAFLFASMSVSVLDPSFAYLTGGYSAAKWFWLLYIAIIGTVIPFGMFFVGINYIRSTKAMITATLEPISAGVVAYVFLGEKLSAIQMAGGALVVMAVILLQARREQDEMAPELMRAQRH